MQREDFYKFVETYLPGVLPEELADRQVKVQFIDKVLKKPYMGLSLMSPSEFEAISPTFNLDDFYESFGDLEEMDCLMKISDFVSKEMAKPFPFQTDNVMNLLKDYDYAKDHLFVAAVPKVAKDTLNDGNYVDHNGIAAVAKIYVDMPNVDRNGSITVSNQMLDTWNKSFEEVYADALISSRNVLQPTINTLESILTAKAGVEFPEPMPVLTRIYCVSNERLLFGASNLFIPGMLDEISEKVGGSFYIIPSSIHEVLVAQVDELGGLNQESIRGLEDMIQIVNDTEVSEDEILSYDLYLYDSKNKELGLAKEMEKNLKNDHKDLNENLSEEEALGSEDKSKAI